MIWLGFDSASRHLITLLLGDPSRVADFYCLLSTVCDVGLELVELSLCFLQSHVWP